MASKSSVCGCICGLMAATLSGCVSVDNQGGLVPPPALCSVIRGTIGVPREPLRMENIRKGESGTAVHVQEWVFSGISANVIDMALQEAVASGGLKKVHYADYEQTSYLGFVTVFNLVAYGE